MRNSIRATPSSGALRAILVGVVVSLLACEPLIVVERDGGPPLAAGSRWAWSATDQDGLAPDDGDVQPSTEIAIAVAEAVTAELADRGFQRTSSDSADFFVHFHLGQRVMTDTMPQLDAPRHVGAGESGSWGGFGRPEALGARTVSWQEGMLIIDALRATEGSVAWRGVIAGEVSPDVAADPLPALRAAVARLVDRFP